MNNFNEITIIIPCFNSADFVGRCLNSIIDQSIGMEHVQIIVIDDCSTDDTLAIIQQYEASYPENILIISLEKNCGQGYARNLALSYANGEYIMFLDSDDAIRADTLEQLLLFLKETGCDVIEFEFSRDYSDLIHYNSNIQPLKLFEITNSSQRRLFCTAITHYGLTCNKIYHRSLIIDHNIRFAEGLLHEDTLFIELILLYAHKYGYSSEKFYYYFDNPAGSMQSRRLNDLRQFDRLAVQLQFLEECERRSILHRYFDIVEALFLRIYYIDTMLFVLQSFTEPPLEKIKEMQCTVLTCFPNFEKNHLLNRTSTKIESYILETVIITINESEFFTLQKILSSFQNENCASQSLTFVVKEG